MMIISGVGIKSSEPVYAKYYMMINVASIPPFHALGTSTDVLKFRLWRMVCDVCDHVCDEENTVVLFWRDESHAVERLVRRFASEEEGGGGDVDGFVYHVVSRLVPDATHQYFTEHLVGHDAFLAGEGPAASRSVDCRDDDAVDDLMLKLYIREKLWFDDFPTDVLEFVVEGWLRMQLAAADRVNDVLCSGYNVRFSAREFVAWFVRELLPLIL